MKTYEILLPDDNRANSGEESKSSFIYFCA